MQLDYPPRTGTSICTTSAVSVVLDTSNMPFVAVCSALCTRAAYVCNWRRKPLFGDMTDRLFFTNSIAARDSRDIVGIRYAHTIVAERDTPIMQCTYEHPAIFNFGSSQ